MSGFQPMLDGFDQVPYGNPKEMRAAIDDRTAAILVEPIQGEGAPGKAVTREFYDLARKLTAQRGTLLLVDSIQAGLRGTGTLSIVDYPGFEDCVIPDMETWSKALNGGQYPLSVLGCNEKAADIYQRGVYGNTMTTNPRALEVGCAVLDLVDDALRQNIRDRGAQLVAGLKTLMDEMQRWAERVVCLRRRRRSSGRAAAS